MARIENNRFTPLQAFRECFYEIPDYQREYVWTEREVGKLLEDLNEQLDASSTTEYFIGTVLVSGSDKGVDRFEVIDGQQRLTTIFLLMAAIKYRLSAAHRAQIEALMATADTDGAGDVVHALRLMPRYEGAVDAFERIVGTAPTDPALRAGLKAAGIRIVGSVERLLDAYEKIAQYLNDNFPTEDKLRAFWGFFANRLVFIQIRTDISTALKIFETINERGVGLNSIDLLKNLLFRQVGLSDFGKLKAAWEAVTGPLDVAKEKPLRFLRYFIMANYPVRNVDGVVREDQIYDWLTKKENRALCNYGTRPFDFVRKIALNVERYLRFRAGRDKDNHDSYALWRLQVMTGAAFSLHYVLLLAVSELPLHLFDHFVRQLESFLFYYVYSKTPTKDLEKSFAAWAEELRAVAAMTDARAQSEALDAFIQQRFAADMARRRGELVDALRRYSTNGMQKYRTSYLLARLTQYVDDAYAGVPGESISNYMRLEIEHMLPQTPEAELRQTWAAEKNNEGKDYDEHVQRLGNLLLLEKPINIVASNDFFAKKLPLYAQSGNYMARSVQALAEVGKNSSITRINKRLMAFKEWNSKSIEDRQQLLADLAIDVWSIQPLS